MEVLINIVLTLFAMLLCYYLALSFAGTKRPFRETGIPVLIFSLITFVSKIVFNAIPPIHTLILVITCAVLLRLINKSSIIVSIISSLLCFITITLGSMLIAYPALIKIGLQLPNETKGYEWVYFNLAENLITILAVILLRAVNFSITKYIPQSINKDH